MKNLTAVLLSTAILYFNTSALAADPSSVMPPPLLPPLPGDSTAAPAVNTAPPSYKAPEGMKELTLPSTTSSNSSISVPPLAPLPTPGRDPFTGISPTTKSSSIDSFPVPPLAPQPVIKAPEPVVAADTTAEEKDKKKKKGHKGKHGKTKKTAMKVAPKISSTYYVSEPLPEAIYKKTYDRLNHHLPVAYYESDYDTLMFITSAHDDVNGLHSLLDNGRNVELVDTAGDTPLLVAVKHGAINAARLLLAHRANPNVKDRAGMTPLQIAVKENNYPLQRALEEMGANCTQVSSAQ